jgi:L-ascorbate metabolism protein UlaG (beta-lactamase superfamily)
MKAKVSNFLKTIKTMFIWIGGVILFLIVLAFLIGWIISAPGYNGPVSDNFDGNKFKNINNVQANGFGEVLKWMVQREKEPWQPSPELPPGSAPKKESENLNITFINHSTFLIQWDGKNILTDPIWSERTSPVSFAGPKRKRPPGILFEDLPTIDVVLISHNHYDHLDLPTIKQLEKKFSPLFVVPLGVDLLLKNKGIERVTVMDWWEDFSYGSFNIACVPAQHFSGRGIGDRDQTLWAGYIIIHEQESLYFVGDTGYGSFFQKIKQKYAPIDVALIPIGAYKPKWFMSPIHISPAEAVKVHQELGIGTSIAMHHGTFPLADDGKDDPINDLQKALQEQQVPANNFVILEEGKAWKK